MKPYKAIPLICVAVFFLGCARKDQVCEGVYNALQMREQVSNPERSASPHDDSMSYQQYKTERKKALEDGGAD